jgi:hypothetical protein
MVFTGLGFPGARTVFRAPKFDRALPRCGRRSQQGRRRWQRPADHGSDEHRRRGRLARFDVGRMGLVNAVYEDAEFDSAVEALTAELASKPPRAVAAMFEKRKPVFTGEQAFANTPTPCSV